VAASQRRTPAISTAVANDSLKRVLRQLVEDERREVHLGIVDDGREHRVAKPAQGRVGGRSPHRHVETPAGEALGEALGAPAREVAPVRDAAGDREAPGERPGRQLGRRGDVPHHGSPARAVRRRGQLHVGAVAAVVGQADLAGGEVDETRHGTQLRAQLVRRRGIGHQLADVAPFDEDPGLAPDRLAVVAQRRAARHRQQADE